MLLGALPDENGRRGRRRRRRRRRSAVRGRSERGKGARGLAAEERRGEETKTSSWEGDADAGQGPCPADVSRDSGG